MNDRKKIMSRERISASVSEASKSFAVSSLDTRVLVTLVVLVRLLSCSCALPG